MDQERNEFEMPGQDVAEAAQVAPEPEDDEIAQIRADAEREAADIEAELAKLDERLEAEYATLGKRAFEYAQTDEVLASRLGVALAAVSAQTEQRGKLSRSLEAVEKKAADRIADVLRARAAEEEERRFEEELARKEAAAQEAMERARALEREAAEARRAREDAKREAEAAALAASQTMLISFTDDAPDYAAFVERVAREDEQAQGVEPQADDLAEGELAQEDAVLEELAFAPEAQQDDASELEDEMAFGRSVSAEDEGEVGELASDAAPEPAFALAFEPETKLAPEPAAGDWSWPDAAMADAEGEAPESSEVASADEPQTLLAPEPETLLAPEGEFDLPGDLEAETAVEPESLLAPEGDFDAAGGSEWGLDREAEQEIEEEQEAEPAAFSPFEGAPLPVPPAEPADPKATLLLDDYEAGLGHHGFDADVPSADPKATLLLDDDLLERSAPAAAPEPEGAQAIVCPVCGAECGERDFFCLKCGTKLDAAFAPAAPAALAPEPEFAPEPEPVFEPEPAHAPRHAAPAAPTCVQCGHELQPGDKFCMYCGTKQPAAEQAAPAAAPAAPANVCSACGFELQPGDKFCMSCGKPVQQVPTDSAPSVPVAKICPNCGAEYTDADKFCMMCGYRL